MHLRTNSEQIAKIAKGDRIEKQKQDLLRYIKQEESHMVFLDDSNPLNPTNDLKQLGQPFTSLDFERRLKTILPSSCIFINNPWRSGFRAVVRVTPTGQETVVPYESGFLPEHSVMQLVEKEVPDTEVVARNRSISRADLPKSEWNGKEFTFDEGIRPGYKKIKQLGRELKRGWRTVLIKCLLAKVVTLSDVERVFGTDDSPTWAQNFKYKDNIVPW